MTAPTPQQNRERYLANRDEVIAGVLERRKLAKDKYRTDHAAYMKKYRSQEQEKRKHAARMRIHRAIKSGKLIRKPCTICKSPRSHAHHIDYSRPLDVQWLCRTHHGAAHRMAS